jgi:hypothetical protein
MNVHLETCLKKGLSSEKVKEALKSVISGAFSL